MSVHLQYDVLRDDLHDTISFNHSSFFLSFFFNDTATTEIYTLSLHDALPISRRCQWTHRWAPQLGRDLLRCTDRPQQWRSEEHTSELQSHSDLVCRLLLEKKKEDRLMNEKVVKTVERYRTV